MFGLKKNTEIHIRWKWPEPFLIFSVVGQAIKRTSQQESLVISQSSLWPWDAVCSGSPNWQTSKHFLTRRESITFSYLWLKVLTSVLGFPYSIIWVLLEHLLLALNSWDPSMEGGALIYSPQEVPRDSQARCLSFPSGVPTVPNT